MCKHSIEELTIFGKIEIRDENDFLAEYRPIPSTQISCKPFHKSDNAGEIVRPVDERSHTLGHPDLAGGVGAGEEKVGKPGMGLLPVLTPDYPVTTGLLSLSPYWQVLVTILFLKVTGPSLLTFVCLDDILHHRDSSYFQTRTGDLPAH